MDLKTGRIHWSTCPWFTSLSTHPCYYFTSYHFTLWLSGRSSFDLTDILLPSAYSTYKEYSAFWQQQHPSLSCWADTSPSFYVQDDFGSLCYWDYNNHICPMLLVFTIYLIPISILGLSSVWPLISRKNFSSPDHHCSNSDSCLFSFPFLLLSEELSNEAVYHLHQIFVCTSHPRSLQYIDSRRKKKIYCSKIWVP